MKENKVGKKMTDVLVWFLIILILFFIISGCSSEKENTPSTKETKENIKIIQEHVKTYETLTEDITWITNDTDPVFSSSNVKKGGTFHLWIDSFPMTFRNVGPDSNGSFRSYIDSNQMGLTSLHPNTDNMIPALATHWAFGKDKKTMYYKLNKKARWSDGVPLTAWDFVYTLEFMRSKHIVAPWYNHFYTTEIDKVIVYDDHTLAVMATKPKPDLEWLVSITPTPRHFYGKLGKDFISRYNWKVIPNTGPYQISEFKKGKYVKFKRKKNWWAKDLEYNKNRFNIDQVVFTIIRDFNIVWEYFKKGKIDAFRIVYPKFWHKKSKTPVVENGYVHKIWFFNNTRRPAQGFYLNQDKEIFKDINLRKAFAHALNIKRVIEKVLRNDYFRLDHGYVGYGKYSNENIRAREYNLKKVTKYMKASGWKRGNEGIWTKKGKRFSVEVSYSFGEITERLVVLREEAKKAGIEIKLQKLDGSAAFKKILEKNHEVAIMAWSTSMRPQYWHSHHSVNAHKPQTNNITNTDNPELDKLIDKYQNSIDADERIKLSVKIQQKIHDDCSFIPTMMVPYVRQAYWRWWRLPEIPGTKHSDDLFDPFGESLFWFDEALYNETRQAMKQKKTFAPVTMIDKTFKPKL